MAGVKSSTSAVVSTFHCGNVSVNTLVTLKMLNNVKHSISVEVGKRA